MNEWMNDECHWCEQNVTRPNEYLRWIDEYDSANCEFHPAAFDHIKLKSTGESAPHQTRKEVDEIIIEHHHRKQQQRNKNNRLTLVKSNKVMISNNARRTSLSAAERFLPRSGSIRYFVYENIKNRGGSGLTDYELEQILNSKHQTVSASRRSLVIDGIIRDSGYTRKNPQGNDCIVWIIDNANEWSEHLDFNA